MGGTWRHLVDGKHVIIVSGCLRAMDAVRVGGAELEGQGWGGAGQHLRAEDGCSRSCEVDERETRLAGRCGSACLAGSHAVLGGAPAVIRPASEQVSDVNREGA